MNKKNGTNLAVALTSLMMTLPALAQASPAVNIGATFGTGAFNLSAARSMNSYFGARANLYVAGEIADTGEVENNTYRISFEPKTSGLLLDYTPFQGHFFIAAGIMSQDINFNFQGELDQEYTFNGTTYRNLNDDVNSLSTVLGFDKSSAPYLGFGWSNRYRESSGFTYSVDIGAVQLGAPTANVFLDCKDQNSSVCVSLTRDIESEKKNITDDFGDENFWYPLLSLGLGYSF